jgi:predicted acyl esterase
VCEGIQRITPDAFATDADGVRSVAVALWPTAYQFKAGHRIRLQVSGGSFPRFARNNGNGEPLGTSVATVPVEYEFLQSSSVTLSVPPREASGSEPVTHGSRRSR